MDAPVPGSAAFPAVLVPISNWRLKCVTLLLSFALAGWSLWADGRTFTQRGSLEEVFVYVAKALYQTVTANQTAKAAGPACDRLESTGASLLASAVEKKP